jgi:hypothetical protein
MSEAPTLHDRIAARLERLAEMDLAAAEHLHAQLLESTEPSVTAELSRAYQRASRTARQTLMLQMRCAKEAAGAAPPPISDAEAARERLTSRRTRDLQDAVGRVAAAAHPDQPRLQREALDRLDIEIDAWDEHRFLREHFDDLVIKACERVRLPLSLARRWEELPKPAETFDPATAGPSPGVPNADTG